MDVRAARRGASPVRAHYPGGNVRGRQTPSGARPNRGAMTWPASLPGRLLEAAGNRGPRGMTVAARERRTEPGLQTGFANSSSFCAFRRYGPKSSGRPQRRRRMPASGEVAPRTAPAGASACTFATVGSSGGGSLGRRCRPAGPRWPGPPAFPRADR